MVKKVVKQLLTEFWLPLVIAIVWSLINLKTMSRSEWSLLKLVNIAAPTFFFVSWLTAQYFRVRKQEAVSSTLTTIESRVDGMMGRVEQQTKDLAYIVEASVLQTFDICIDSFRDAKEELADRSRMLKASGFEQEDQFLLQRGNPFYAPRCQLNTLVSYAFHVEKANHHAAMKDRYTRCAYHIEELAGHIGVYINRLNHYKVDWKSERSSGLVMEVCTRIEQFEQGLLKYSKYAIDGYKGSQSLSVVLRRHVHGLRAAVT